MLYVGEKYTVECCKKHFCGVFMDKKIILARIDELMKEKGISNYQIKENADISSTIYQWRKNATRDKDRTPSLRSIEKICDYLGVSLSYFFSFNKEEQLETRDNDLYSSICKLNSEQKRVCEEMVRQFALANCKD